MGEAFLMLFWHVRYEKQAFITGEAGTELLVEYQVRSTRDQVPSSGSGSVGEEGAMGVSTQSL